MLPLCEVLSCTVMRLHILTTLPHPSASAADVLFCPAAQALHVEQAANAELRAALNMQAAAIEQLANELAIAEVLALVAHIAGPVCSQRGSLHLQLKQVSVQRLRRLSARGPNE